MKSIHRRIFVGSICFQSTYGFLRYHSRQGGAVRLRSVAAAWRGETSRQSSTNENHEVDICIVGGGVSGLAAAVTATRETTTPAPRVVVLEATPTCGGRVQSDISENGLIIDRGFAVFIEQYPMARLLLDYDKLDLCPFQPGALVKLDGRKELARIADPLRQPTALLDAIMSPIGSLGDKLKVVALVLHVRLNSVDHLFAEKETDTFTALKHRWGFSEQMITAFFKPFFQGIFLCPLDEQSSRLFHFVFKMFTEGSASLPKHGIGAISEQLKSQTTARLITDCPVKRIIIQQNGMFRVESSSRFITARSVIVATEGPVSKSLLSTVKGLEGLKVADDQPQRMVGCLYYSFRGKPPVEDPILILNGETGDSCGGPINNVCFPTVVMGPASEQQRDHICSVAVLEDALLTYGDNDSLDQSVRRQLGDWFPAHNIASWKLEGIYRIANAQPAQLGGPQPANRLRPNDEYRGKPLPPGLFVCGDNVSTASLNGALESGCNAAKAALAYLRQSQEA